MCLFHLAPVVVQEHNLVEFRDLLARIPMAVAVDMFPLGHVLFLLNLATCQQMHAAWTAYMVIGPNHVAFVQRNSGYDTFMKDSMWTNRKSDAKTALKELKSLSYVGLKGAYLNCLKFTGCLAFQLHFQNCISKTSFMKSIDEKIIFIHIYDLCKNNLMNLLYLVHTLIYRKALLTNVCQ